MLNILISISVFFYICAPADCTLTRSLEIECNELGATDPHGQGVVVGGVKPLSSWIHSGKLTAIVL